MSRQRVIGIDPGPTPGIVVIDSWPNGAQLVDVVQCSASVAGTVLVALLDTDVYDDRAIVQIEDFVVGRSSMRSGRAGAQTRELIGSLVQTCTELSAVAVLRTASQVKPWATDRRLQAAVMSGDTNLWLATAGMRHARDAARHALFCAVHDAGAPDPLSRTRIPATEGATR